MVLSMVIHLGRVIHHGIIRMVSMVTIHHGIPRAITVITGDLTGDIVVVQLIVDGNNMATATPGMPRRIAGTVAGNMKLVKRIPRARMVLPTETAILPRGISLLRPPVIPVTRVWLSGVTKAQKSVKAGLNRLNRSGRHQSAPGHQQQVQCPDHHRHHQ